MTRLAAALSAALSISLGGARAARADEAEQRSVVILDTRSPAIEDWPAGERAVLAELAASSKPVTVRPSQATTPEALLGELERAAAAPGTAGAVCIFRSGEAGVALVWLSGSASAVRVEDDVSQGVVAEGAVALRVTELLHVRTYRLPEPPTPPEPAPPAPPPPPAPAPAPAPAVDVAPFAWIGVGFLASSGGATPSAAFNAGVRVPLFSPLGLEVSGTASLGRLAVETSAGEARIDLQALSAHAVFEPWAEESLSASFALGGGAAWLSEIASPNQGFDARSDATAVGTLSARLSGAWRTGNLRLVALFEPGLLLPPVTVRADERAIATLGRPYFLTALGVGIAP